MCSVNLLLCSVVGDYRHRHTGQMYVLSRHAIQVQYRTHNKLEAVGFNWIYLKDGELLNQDLWMRFGEA